MTDNLEKAMGSCLGRRFYTKLHMNILSEKNNVKNNDKNYAKARR